MCLIAQRVALLHTGPGISQHLDVVKIVSTLILLFSQQESPNGHRENIMLIVNHRPTLLDKKLDKTIDALLPPVGETPVPNGAQVVCRF